MAKSRAAYARRDPVEKIVRKPPAGYNPTDFDYLYKVQPSDLHRFINYLAHGIIWRKIGEQWEPSRDDLSVPGSIPLRPFSEETKDEANLITEFFGAARHIVVDLTYPDLVIKEQLAKWLAEKRKTTPYPFGRRGPKSEDGDFLSRQKLYSFRDHKIFQLAYIEQSPEHQREQYTNRALADLLFSDLQGTDEAKERKVKKARELYAEAIRYRNVIEAGVKHIPP